MRTPLRALRGLRGLGLAAGAMLLAHSAMAQGAHPATTAMAVTAGDTGLLTRGHVDFSHYETPADCLAASWLVIRSTLVRRAPDALDPQDHDTLQGAMETDTMPPEAITVARRCGSKFSAAGVAKEDVGDLQQLAVLMRDSALTAATLARRLSLATTVRERADVLMATIELDRAARPAALEATVPVLAKLDALGPAARGDQMRAHMELVRDYRKRFDRVGIKREADRVIALFDAMPAAEREAVSDTAREAYGLLTDVQQFENPKGIYALLDRARADIGTTPRGKQQITPKVDTLVMPNGQPFAPPRTSVRPGWFTHEWWDSNHREVWWDVDHFETTFPKLPYWWDRNGPTTARPLPGKVTLFVGDDDESLIRKLHERYGDGLDLVMEVQTVGFADVDGQPHVMQPEQEAEAYRQRYLEKAHLPIALGVGVTAFTYDSVTGERHDEPPTGRHFGLLDRDGRFVTTWLTFPYADDLARIEAYLDRELAKH